MKAKEKLGGEKGIFGMSTALFIIIATLIIIIVVAVMNFLSTASRTLQAMQKKGAEQSQGYMSLIQD